MKRVISAMFALLLLSGSIAHACVPPTITEKLPGDYLCVTHCDYEYIYFAADPGWVDYVGGEPATIVSWELTDGYPGPEQINEYGEFTVDCLGLPSSPHTVTIKVINSCGGTDEYTFTVECVMTEISHGAGPPGQIVCDGETYEYVFDFDLEYPASCDPPNVTWFVICGLSPWGGNPLEYPEIDGSGRLTWNVNCAHDAGGTYDFRVMVMDDCGGMDDYFFSVEVLSLDFDFYIRDCKDDPGADHTGGPGGWCNEGLHWWASPDIYFANGDDPTVQSDPWIGTENRLWFIVRNRSELVMPAADVTLHAYYMPATAGIKFPVSLDLDPENPELPHKYIGGLEFEDVASGSSVRNFIVWDPPKPEAEDGHFCVGAVLNATRDPHLSKWVNEDNNVAQINWWGFKKRIGHDIPGEKGLAQPTDSPVWFHAVFTGCNPEPFTGSYRVFIDTDSLPFAWRASVDKGPFLLPENSCVDIDVWVCANNPRHNETAFIPVEWWLEGDPPHLVGGGVFSFGIDDYAADTVTDLEASCVGCEESSKDSRTWVRLDWSRPLLDLANEEEHLLGFFVYGDTEPGVDESDLLDSTAIDWNLDMPRWQWYDKTTVAGGPTRYYRVAAVDGAHNVSALSNEVSITIGKAGDADCSQGIDIDDAVYLINYVFAGGDEPKPLLCVGDANGDGGLDIDDIVYLILYIFADGDPPVPACS